MLKRERLKNKGKGLNTNAQAALNTSKPLEEICHNQLYNLLSGITVETISQRKDKAGDVRSGATKSATGEWQSYQH